jgi:hypothetical protein
MLYWGNEMRICTNTPFLTQSLICNIQNLLLQRAKTPCQIPLLVLNLSVSATQT